jgi:hypothetical protein
MIESLTDFTGQFKIASQRNEEMSKFDAVSITDTIYYVQEQRRINGFLSNMAQKLRFRRQNKVLDEWVCTVDDSLKLKETARKVIRHLMNRTLSGAFTTWWNNADRRRKQAQRALRIVQRLRNRNQVTSMEVWNHYAHERHRLQECLEAGTRIFQRSTLAWSLEEWSCNVYNLAEQRRRHQMLRQKVVRRLQNLLLIVCWERWCDNVDLKSRVRICPGCWIWIPTRWLPELPPDDDSEK